MTLKTIKLDVKITENEFDRSHRIGRKKERDQDQLLLN